MTLIDNLDITVETCPLNVSERDALSKENNPSCKPQREEEAKWAHRAKVKPVQEGGNNMKYFPPILVVKKYFS
jgi:hypothetical protein